MSVATFANVSALEQFDLRGIDINILRALPKLSTLYLYGNPLLQCDCQLQEVWRWCQDRNIQIASGERESECDTPSEVKGIWWGVLEKGQCLLGNIQYYGDYKNTSYSYSDIKILYLYKYNSEFLKHYQVPVYGVPFIFGTRAMSSFSSLSYATKTCEMFPICTS